MPNWFTSLTRQEVEKKEAPKYTKTVLKKGDRNRVPKKGDLVHIKYVILVHLIVTSPGSRGLYKALATFSKISHRTKSLSALKLELDRLVLGFCQQTLLPGRREGEKVEEEGESQSILREKKRMKGSEDPR